MAALRASDFSSLPTLDEELKQGSAARKVIGYAIQQHDARQHAAIPTLPLVA